jgi:hypothetical protein
MTKSTRMRWAGHVGRMEKMRNPCKILVGRCEEKRGLGWLDVNVRIILKCMLRLQVCRLWTIFTLLGIETTG